jgi:hypothetical protein
MRVVREMLTRDFKMFDLMYGLDVPIKNDDNEDV